MPNIKRLIKSLLEKQGFDSVFHPIAKTPYHGPKIAFVHIAKCGGMSVDNALRQAIALPDQPRIDREATLAASMASFNRIISNAQDSAAFSHHHAQNLSGILDYYLSKQWQYISGHVTITSDILDRHADNYAFVTVLRNPVQRFISNYIYNKLTNKNLFMLPNVHNKDNLIDEAEQILTSERGWQLANTTSMFLTGRYPKSETDANDMQIEVARNLSKFKVVGFLESMTSFEQQCSELTGKQIKFGQLNSSRSASKTGKNHEAKGQIQSVLNSYFNQPDTIKKLEHLCRFELANYESTQSLYAK